MIMSNRTTSLVYLINGGAAWAIPAFLMIVIAGGLMSGGFEDDHQAATVTKPGVGVAVSDEATHAELQQLQQIELRILPAIMEPLAAQALKDDPAR